VCIKKNNRDVRTLAYTQQREKQKTPKNDANRISECVNINLCVLTKKKKMSEKLRICFLFFSTSQRSFLFSNKKTVGFREKTNKYILSQLLIYFH